jgi:hypothetical protein
MEGRLKDTTQARLGAEYLLIGANNVIAFRTGIFSDPEPQVGGHDRFYGYTLGTGYSTSRFSFDAAYQFREGKDVASDVLSVNGSAVESKMDVTQKNLMVSVIVYF